MRKLRKEKKFRKSRENKELCKEGRNNFDNFQNFQVCFQNANPRCYNNLNQNFEIYRGLSIPLFNIKLDYLTYLLPLMPTFYTFLSCSTLFIVCTALYHIFVTVLLPLGNVCW